MRAGALLLGALIGIIPLLLYNHAAFGSWTHIAYANIKQQQQGFFGISTPRPKVLITLLFDSRGMLTISPVLILGGVGTWLLYRRGKRAEALVDHGDLAGLPDLQLGLLPALRRGLAGAALHDHDAALPGLPAGHRHQALPRADHRPGCRLDHDDLHRHGHPSAGRLRERDGRLGAAAQQGRIPADDRLGIRPGPRLGSHLAVRPCRWRRGRGGAPRRCPAWPSPPARSAPARWPWSPGGCSRRSGRRSSESTTRAC